MALLHLRDDLLYGLRTGASLLRKIGERQRSDRFNPAGDWRNKVADERGCAGLVLSHDCGAAAWSNSLLHDANSLLSGNREFPIKILKLHNKNAVEMLRGRHKKAISLLNSLLLKAQQGISAHQVKT